MPATPLPLVPGLFSNRVASFEVRFGASLTPLLDSEEACVARAVEKRKWEFRAGRHCARRALGALGVSEVALPSGPDRAPLWPAGFVGSITHTGTGEHAYAAAVVARASDVRALGIDAELAEPLAEGLWSRVLTPVELAFVETLDSREQGLVAMLYFSAKEAYYKCQYTLTQRFLGFHEVEVAFELERNRFRARLRGEPSDFGVTGQFVRDSGLIVTGLELSV